MSAFKMRTRLNCYDQSRSRPAWEAMQVILRKFNNMHTILFSHTHKQHYLLHFHSRWPSWSIESIIHNIPACYKSINKAHIQANTNRLEHIQKGKIYDNYIWLKENLRKIKTNTEYRSSEFRRTLCKFEIQWLHFIATFYFLTLYIFFKQGIFFHNVGNLSLKTNLYQI